MTKIDAEVRRLDHQIATLLEQNSKAWRDLFEKPLTKDQRSEIRSAISTGSQELFKLLEWKWEIKR